MRSTENFDEQISPEAINQNELMIEMSLNVLTSVIATSFGIWLLGKIGRVTVFKAGIIGTMISLLTIAPATMTLKARRLCLISYFQ